MKTKVEYKEEITQMERQLAASIKERNEYKTLYKICRQMEDLQKRSHYIASNFYVGSGEAANKVTSTQIEACIDQINKNIKPLRRKLRRAKKAYNKLVEAEEN